MNHLTERQRYNPPALYLVFLSSFSNSTRYCLQIASGNTKIYDSNPVQSKPPAGPTTN